MLSVHFGRSPESIYNTSVYFKNTYKDTWFQDDFAKRMIKSIDRAEVLGDGLIRSRVLGLIPPTQLSGGLKTLLLLRNEPNRIYNATTCGNNCAWWILKMAHNCDITIDLYHLMDFGNGKFTIRVTNTDTIVHDMDGFIMEAAKASERGEL